MRASGSDPAGLFISEPFRASTRSIDRALEQVLELRDFLGSLESQTLRSADRSLSQATTERNEAHREIRNLGLATESGDPARGQVLSRAATSVLAAAT